VQVGEVLEIPVRRRVPSVGSEAVGGLDAVFRDVAAETGLRCWLVSGTGRLIAGAGELSRPTALRLAAQFQVAQFQAAQFEAAQFHGTVPGPSGGGPDGPVTLFPLGDGGGRPRVTSWFLACAGDQRDWTREELLTVTDLAADAAHERARLAARLSGERGLAEAVIGRLTVPGGTGAEAEPLLRAAGLEPGYLAVALRVERGAGPGDVALDRDLAEELLIPYAGRAAVAPAEQPRQPGQPVREIYAVLQGTDATALAAWLRDCGPVLRAAGIALTAGVSGPVPAAAGLPGALREASGARSAVAQRPAADAGVLVVTSAEVDSHELLLASVPAPVLRSFRERLLGPLTEYDARHNAELLPTLRSFLACDGSWSACAARLYVHVNTVRYRISRIEALTGRDLSALPDRVDFFLALRGT
jgi:hypothetical protein